MGEIVVGTGRKVYHSNSSMKSCCSQSKMYDKCMWTNFALVVC